MKFEKSCGVVVFKEENGKLFILLVHHNEGHWGIPKGHMENGECEEETAIREVHEETGILSEIIGNFKESINYLVKENVQKEVVFFIGRPIGGTLNNQDKEVQEAIWVEEENIFDVLIHDDVKELLKKAISSYKNR